MPLRNASLPFALMLGLAVFAGCVDGDTLGPAGNIPIPEWAPGHSWEWEVTRSGWVEDTYNGRVDVGGSWRYGERVLNDNVGVGDKTAYWLATSGDSPLLLVPGLFPDGDHSLVDKADLGRLGYVFVEAPQGCKVALVHPYAERVDLLRFPLHDDATWSGEVDGMIYRAAVAGTERVETHDGTFAAVRIDLTFTGVQDLYRGYEVRSASLELTLWYAPEVKRFVRLVESHHGRFDPETQGETRVVEGLAPEQDTSSDSLTGEMQASDVRTEMILAEHSLAVTTPEAAPTVIFYGENVPTAISYPLQVYRGAVADTNLANGSVNARLFLAQGDWRMRDGQEVVALDAVPETPWFDPRSHRVLWILFDGQETEVVRTETPVLERAFDAVARWTIDAQIELIPGDTCAPAVGFSVDVLSGDLPIFWQKRYPIDREPGPRPDGPPLEEVPMRGYANMRVEWSRESATEAVQDRTSFFADDASVVITEGTGVAELPAGPGATTLRWDARGPGVLDVDDPILVGHTGYLDVLVSPSRP